MIKTLKFWLYRLYNLKSESSRIKMDYSSGLEYVVNSGRISSYSKNNYSAIDYLSKSVDDNYSFKSNSPIVFDSPITVFPEIK